MSITLDRRNRVVSRTINGNTTYYTYDVYGTPTISSSAGVTLTSSAVGNRFLFTGREYLAEIGLYDYRNRVYSPGLGRFLQTDSIRFQRANR